MAIEITDLDYTKAAGYLPQTSAPYSYEEALARVVEENDFWQMGRRYKGPLPASDDYIAGMALLKKSYVPVMKIKECSQRHVRGVIGQEPLFETVLDGIKTPKRERRAPNYTPNNLEALADAADDVQGDVWDERGEHKTAKLACLRLCCPSFDNPTKGTVYLRYDVPPGLLTSVPSSDGTTTGVTERDWQKTYRLTHMEVCQRGTASVVVDPATMREIAFYSYTEPLESDPTKTRQCIQVSAVRADGLTEVRIVRSDNTVSDNDQWVTDTGGYPLVLKAEIDALVTPDLLQMQDIACSIATMVKINADVAGFPQKDMIDIEKPAAPLPQGARTHAAHYSYVDEDESGQVLTDTNGKPILRTGRIMYREPVSSQPLRDDIEFLTTEIYRGFNQGHIASRRSANSSAELLIAERADYADSLLETKPDLERLLRNVFKARLCLAASLAQDASTLAQFKAGRVRVDLRLNAGPISTLEAAEIRAQIEEGLMTKETGMVLLRSVDDVQAEVAKLEEQSATPQQLNPVPKGAAPTKQLEKVA